MLPSEARRVVESLANGIDPVTGETLPAESPFNSPQVIRALFLAGKALENAARPEKRHPSSLNNAGKAWSEEEDRVLLVAFDSRQPVKEIALKHARTQGAIASRLVRLGRIKERVEAHARD